jgi:hypothetical protein
LDYEVRKWPRIAAGADAQISTARRQPMLKLRTNIDIRK